MSQQLHEAHELIEEGRVDDARQVLQSLDDPTARLWLAQLNAHKRPREGARQVPLPLLVAVGAVVAVVMLIVILLLTPTLLNRLQNQAANSAAISSTEETLQASLAHYCTMLLSYGGEEPCTSWVEQVTQQYHAAAAACIQPGVETAEARAKVGDCLAQSGVPAPL